MGVRVLLLYGTVGGGHWTVARALAGSLRALGGPEVEVAALDAYAPSCSAFPLRVFPFLYQLSIVHLPPWCLDAFVRVTDNPPGFALLERLVQPANQRGLSRHLARWQPDVVVDVVAGWAGSVQRAIRRTGSTAPVVTVVTDLVAIHRAWTSRAAVAHVVPTAEAAAASVAAGIAPARIHCLGLPVARRFTMPAPPRAEARRRLGLAPAMPTVLLMGGAEGSGRLEAIVHALARIRPHVQLVVIAGRNERLRRRLSASTSGAPRRVLGFVDEVADWMHAADILITKAGSLTVMEAVHLGLPMVLTDCLPHETATARYLSEHGAAEVAGDPAAAARVTADLLDDPARRTALERCGAALRRPNAARDVAALILQTAAVAPHETHNARGEVEDSGGGHRSWAGAAHRGGRILRPFVARGTRSASGLGRMSP